MTSFNLDINPRKRKRGRFINRVRNELQKAVSEEAEEKGMTQAALAKVLGVNRSVLSRRLNGKANLTLSSIADLAWAMGRDIEFALVKADVVAGGGQNYFTQSPIDIELDGVAKPQVSHPQSQSATTIRLTSG